MSHHNLTPLEERVRFLEASLEKEQEHIQVLRRIVQDRGVRIKSLAFRLSTAQNQLFWKEEQLKRYQNLELAKNEKWAKSQIKLDHVKRSLVGMIKKLEKELEELRKTCEPQRSQDSAGSTPSSETTNEIESA